MTLPHVETLFSQGRFLEVKLHTESAAKAGDLRAMQLHALALSKSGTPAAAESFFKPVYEAYPDDPECAGIMGGILKELFKNTQDQQYATQSREIYLRNFQQTKNYYTGINAATMFALTGRSVTGRELATQVLETLPETPGDFWELVTQAEATLLLKKQKEATDLYLESRKQAANDWGRVSSVYHQLWLMNHYFPVPKAILSAFQPPAVAVFVGHMIDRPGANPRFPSSIEKQVKESMASWIRTNQIQIGYCSLACGGDILFAETLTEMGGEVSICLPFDADDFLTTSVRFAGEEWVERFHKLKNRWPAQYLSHDRFRGEPGVFALHGRMLLGIALLRARMTHTEPHFITVLSGLDRTMKEGGTRDLLKLWPYPKLHHNIDPSQFVQPAFSGSGTDNSVSSDWRTLYLIALEMPGLTSVEEANKLINRLSPEFASELVFHHFEAGRWAMGVTTSFGAVRFFRALANAYYTKTTRKDIRTSFHAGVVEVTKKGDTRQASGQAIEVSEALLALVEIGSVLASAPFAASLLLDLPDTRLFHAGSWRPEGETKELEVYRLEL